MNSLKLLALILVGILVFGCIGPTPTNNNQSSNQTIQNNNTINRTVTVIVNPQQNQTVEQNGSTQLPIQVNTSDYIYDPNSPFVAYFINIAPPGMQGNALLVRKGDFTMLVDGGPAENSAILLDFLNSKGVSKINLMVSTNADPRNYGGLSAVENNYPVTEFWYGIAGTDQNYNQLIAHMNQAGTSVKTVQQGMSSNYNGMYLDILNPPFSNNQFTDTDNNAVVMRITDGNFTMLVTSNILTGAQTRITNIETNLTQVQLMEAPYYGLGSGTNQIDNFLLRANPQAMIITGSSDVTPTNTGTRNRFEQLLNVHHIKYYEVFANGTIKIISDGQTYAIQTG